MASKVNERAKGSEGVKHVSNTNIETEVRGPPEYPTVQHHLSPDSAGLSGDNHTLTSLHGAHSTFGRKKSLSYLTKLYIPYWKVKINYGSTTTKHVCVPFLSKTHLAHNLVPRSF